MLNDRALLVQLTISQWTARKYDKRVSAEVTASHGAVSAAGRFNKALLPMNEKLENIHRKSTQIRTFFYDNTLPWGWDGTMLLPAANYLDFTTEFRRRKAEWEQLVEEFLNGYDQMQVDAWRILGSLYDSADYPSVAELERKFKIDLAVFPVPDTDFRVNLTDEELSRIRSDIERRVRNAEKTAMLELWHRLYERVKHMAEKLSDPEAVFRNSMIENIRELCALLPKLNFANDPNLEAMRQQIEASLLQQPDALRQDMVLRHNTAAEAKRIMDKMSVFMGEVK